MAYNIYQHALVFLQDFSTSWDIKATPTFFFLKEGQQIDKLVGANKIELERKITAMADSLPPNRTWRLVNTVSKSLSIFTVLWMYGVFFLYNASPLLSVDTWGWLLVIFILKLLWLLRSLKFWILAFFFFLYIDEACEFLPRYWKLYYGESFLICQNEYSSISMSVSITKRSVV